MKDHRYFAVRSSDGDLGRSRHKLISCKTAFNICMRPMAVGIQEVTGLFSPFHRRPFQLVEMQIPGKKNERSQGDAGISQQGCDISR